MKMITLSRYPSLGSALSACGALLLVSSVALPEARAQDDACARVMAGYGQVEELYRRGDFEGAASFLQAASVLCPDEPLLVYNLARTLERRSDQLRAAGDPAGAEAAAREALAAYRRFLASGAGDAEVIARATERRNALAADLDTEADIGSAPVEDASADGVSTEVDGDDVDGAGASCGGSAEPWPWVVVGVGLASIVTGILVGADASALADRADAAPNHAETVHLLDEARARETAANVLLIGGGVVTAAGGIWGIFDVVEATRPRRCEGLTRLEVGPVGVSLRASF